MEKLQTLALILFGLAAFVWRLIQKARETTRQEQQERPAAARAPLPGSSFDDLLQQMQQQNARGNAPTATPATTPGGRRLPHEEARAARTLEQPAARAVSQERRGTNVSLERAAPVARRGTGIQHDTPSTPPKPPTPTAATSRRASLNARLRSPAELREAFILGEILKRKFE